MVAGESRREALVERLAEYLLANGMAAASLRPLAKAAGTSDRMLLYYFESRADVIATTLSHIAERMRAALDEAVPAEMILPYPVLLATVWRAVASPSLRAFMRLWLQLAAAAATGQEPEKTVAGSMLDGFVAWVGGRLSPAARRRDEDAAHLVATIEGALMLDAVGRRDLADLAVARGAQA